MSPRPGGEADKFGNRFEARWTIRQLLDVMAGRAVSMVVEQVGQAGEGIEFALTRNDGTVEGHQVKRQRGNANSWSIRNLAKEDVLKNAAKQVRLGRQFHFVSVVPSRKLDELADRARRANDLQSFIDGLGEQLGQEFNTFKAAIGSADDSFAVLQGLFVRWLDEREVRATNAALSGLMIKGAPAPTAAVALGDLVLENLGLELDASTIRAKLGEYELTAADLVGAPDLADAVQGVYENWRASIQRELLQPEIKRDEAAHIAAALTAEDRRTILARGTAGAGKSAVLHQVVTQIAREWPVLALRLDRIEPFSSPHELGADRLGLPASPVASLAAVAGDRESLLVVDQLDAVSKASGRMPETFDAIADVLREAAAFPKMRVLVACRQFDIDNDDRLRRLVADEEKVAQVAIESLSDAQLTDAVAAMGLNPAHLTAHQREILRTPLNLVLLQAIADEDQALTFTTSKDLLDAFWDRKRRDCRSRRNGVRFADSIAVVVDYMSDSQRLVAPEAVLDAGDLLDDAEVLTSEHVLVRDGRNLAFFHEAFFDYAFARRWILRRETLVQFLRTGEQELFRRGQVRQVLTHLRDEDRDRFITEVDALLADDQIRFHIKEVVLALFRALPDPSTGEWLLVNRQIQRRPTFEPRLWSGLRTSAWFYRLDAEGVLEHWLGTDDPELHARALEIMIAAPNDHGTRLAELVAPHAHREQFPGWLRWIVRFADLEKSRALLELVLDAVRAGRYDGFDHDLWMSAHLLGDNEPAWACELISAWLLQRPNALSEDDDGRIADLESRDYHLIELIGKAAAGAPADFATALIPYALEAMRKTSDGGEPPLHDRHFGYRTWNYSGHDVGDALLRGLAQALRLLAQEDNPALEPLLSALADDVHDGAQWLLYEALAAGAPRRAEWAAQILLTGEHRLSSGYTSSPYWTTRELLKAIGPAVTSDTVSALEAMCMSFSPDWESRAGAGRSQLTLLSALPQDRLSEPGRRRLGELRRRFDQHEPEEPTGVRVGFIGPPIPETATKRMSDEDWLRAIAKYDTDDRDWSSFTGGAEQLARLLETETKDNPDRFAALALHLDESSHPAYMNAILQGLGNTDADADPDRVFEVMRYASSLDRSDHDRWIPWAVRRHLAEPVPDDIVQLILDRALGSPDPSEDSWVREAGTGGAYYGGDPWQDGMNTARGEACIVLGDLLMHDADGRSTALVSNSFAQLASDPVIAVRTCVAHLLAAGLRHAREEAVAAFDLLIATDDRLLATDPVEQLVVYIGFGNPNTVRPVTDRMLSSAHESVRVAGGQLAAFAALELGLSDLLTRALASETAVRKGTARVCAQRLPFAGDGAAAANALRTLFNDEDDGVRDAAAEVAGALRHRDLRPHYELLEALIASDAFPDAIPQLLLTLEYATERVDELVISTARRFLDHFGGDIDNIATAAAGHGKELGELVLRAYAQASGIEGRALVLDLIDDLLEHAAYNFSKLVSDAER